ncbi:MAG: 4-hydroxythreonine-4-phosphate dehydrogenase PdxA [Bacteroidetes bacterium]|nr:4-hydroxythreonine-4-phosphate dehydrogenase PdxA [Bacteroidota bacterium]
MKPTIAVTVGDFNGIGPEVALRAASDPAIRRLCQPILIGPLAVFRHAAPLIRRRLTLEKRSASAPGGSALGVMDIGDGIAADVTYGAPTKASGKNAGLAIERAVELCLSGKVDAMVTAPASKEALHMAGYDFPGQTEMVTLFSRSQKVIMMLVSRALRVGLVTVHTPIAAVPRQVTAEKVIEKLQLLHGALMRDFGIPRPKIAVLGLNPHAGENGHIGREEVEIILPALEVVRAAGIIADGPFPADAFFGKKRHTSYDAVLAMYHDQGLIPLKLMSFGSAVNVSAGLPIIRTSPDHGTAYDIAGKGTADPSSTIEAIRLAVAMNKARSGANA